MPPFTNLSMQCHPERIRKEFAKDGNAFAAPMQMFARVPYLIAFLYLIYLHSAAAEHTRTWRQASYEDFLKGTRHGVAVRSDGWLELAPKFTLIPDADASYLWSLRSDPRRTLYAASSSPAQLLPF